MERQEFVRQLTRSGVLVTPDILERIASGEITRPEDVSAPARGGGGPKLSVVIKKHDGLERMSPQDFTAYYRNRYAGLRGILMKKMQAVSINKAGTGTGEVSVMGMVRERNPHGFVIEDETGELAVLSGEDVQEDDVVGVRGEMREGKILQKEIVWPDIPLSNQARAIPGVSILFATFLDDNIKKACGDISLIFMPEDPKEAPNDSKKLISGLPNPCAAAVKKDGKEFNILIYRPGREMTTQEAVEMLRKRHLSPERKSIRTKTDPFLIDPVPDAFWLISKSRHVERYKGVTIIITKADDAVKYDAGTGETYFAYG